GGAAAARAALHGLAVVSGGRLQPGLSDHAVAAWQPLRRRRPRRRAVLMGEPDAGRAHGRPGRALGTGGPARPAGARGDRAADPSLPADRHAADRDRVGTAFERALGDGARVSQRRSVRLEGSRLWPGSRVLRVLPAVLAARPRVGYGAGRGDGGPDARGVRPAAQLRADHARAATRERRAYASAAARRGVAGAPGRGVLARPPPGRVSV